MRKLLAATAIGFILLNVACRNGEHNGNANHNTNARAETNSNAGKKSGGGGDGWITMKVKLALLANSPTSGFETDVDTKDGAVTLTGIVDTNEAKAAAGEEAKKIDGVKSVNNQLQVVAEAKRKEVNATDDKIMSQISEAMDNDPKLKGLSLAVDSNAGVVSLDGTVDTNEQLLYAAQVMRKVPGVKSVVTSAVNVGDE